MFTGVLEMPVIIFAVNYGYHIVLWCYLLLKNKSLWFTRWTIYQFWCEERSHVVFPSVATKNLYLLRNGRKSFTTQTSDLLNVPWCHAEWVANESDLNIGLLERLRHRGWQQATAFNPWSNAQKKAVVIHSPNKTCFVNWSEWLWAARSGYCNMPGVSITPPSLLLGDSFILESAGK